MPTPPQGFPLPHIVLLLAILAGTLVVGLLWSACLDLGRIVDILERWEKERR